MATLLDAARMTSMPLTHAGRTGRKAHGDSRRVQSARSRKGHFFCGYQPHSERNQGPFLGARKKRDRSQIQALTDRLSTWSPRLGENEYPRYLEPILVPEGGKRRTYGENLKPLKFYVKQARKSGFRIRGNGGGWKTLARITTGTDPQNKLEARAALLAKFGASGYQHQAKPFAQTDAFLSSYEWRRVRMVVLKRDGATCAACNATRASGRQMNVDHIKPRKIYPELALDPSNLQVLCADCNHGKGNWDMTDWRAKESA